MNFCLSTPAYASVLAVALVSCVTEPAYFETQGAKIPEPQPQTIAYVSTESQAGWEIYVTQDLNDTYRLTFGGMSTAPSWSRDKRWIVYQRAAPGPKSTIWRMKYDGDEKRMLTSSYLQSENPRYSPDGTKILFHQEHDGRIDVYLIDSAGANQALLSTPQIIPQWIQTWFWLADWSPDGHEVIFCLWRTDKPLPNSSLGVLTLQTGAFRTLARLDSLVPMYPRWSPTRPELAFVGILPGTSGQFDVFRANTDGTNVIRLSSSGASRDPAWSPDGEDLLFTKIDTSNGITSTWIMSRDGDNQRPLLSNPYTFYSSPVM